MGDFFFKPAPDEDGADEETLAVLRALKRRTKERERDAEPS